MLGRSFRDYENFHFILFFQDLSNSELLRPQLFSTAIFIIMLVEPRSSYEIE